MSDGAYKVCSGCSERLPGDVEHFYRNRTEPDGLDYYCKACRARIARWHYQAYRPAIRRQQAEYRAARNAGGDR